MTRLKRLFSIVNTKAIFLFSFLFFHSFFLAAQEKKKIEVLGAESLTLVEVNGQKARKLSGNVRLKQEETTLECDSALFYITINAVDAYGNVHIFDEKDLNIYSDSLKYDGELRTARFFGNVKIIENQSTLETDFLTYYTETKTAFYSSGGKIVNEDMTLTSRKGYYYSSSRNAHFKDSVVLHGKTYDLFTDTLQYNIDTKVAYFFGPTDIITQENIIYCESGWYDTNTDISVFGENTRLLNGAQKLFADSLYYENQSGYGRAYKFFQWTDTTMDVVLSGKHAVYFQQQEKITATDSAMLIYIIEDDSLFMSADTLKSAKDTIADVTEFWAFHDVKIYKSDLQGLCDSLFFSFKDSVIIMYREPILWNENNQLTGDTISIVMSNQKIDRVEMYENGFIINEAQFELYNQIKGRRITGFFEEKKLDRMLANGNGESVYYATDENDALLGLNKALCSDMWIHLKDEKVNRIIFLAKPDATFHPIQQVNTKDFILKGFLWRVAERPLVKEDIFR